MGKEERGEVRGEGRGEVGIQKGVGGVCVEIVCWGWSFWAASVGWIVCLLGRKGQVQ